MKFLETPTIIQFDVTECGPVALGIILAHYGRPVPVAELCDACEIEKYGSTASRILQAARQYGLQARAVRQPPLNARENKTPFIAHWQDDHFVVIEQFESGLVFVNDPAYGRRTIREEEFAADFSGVALLLEPAALPEAFIHQPLSDNYSDALFEELASGIRGRVGRLPRQLEQYQVDFGRLKIRTPRLVVKAICEEDIIHTLRVASQVGIPVVTRGAGHARHGQSLSEGGILLVNYLDTAVAQFEMLDEVHVEVTARTRWGALERELNQIGRSVPVIPAYGNLSVGGTLSVGGYGERSIQYGSQIHHVRRLRIITPDGAAHWCSAHSYADWFRYSLAGLGQLGVIENVVIETIPYQELGPLRYYRHQSQETFLDALAKLMNATADELPHFAAYILKDRGIYSEHGRPAGMTISTPAQSVEEVLDPPAFQGQDAAFEGFRLAADYLFDFAGLRAYLQFLEQIWQTTAFGRYTDWALLLAVRQGKSAITFPLEAVPTGHPPVAFLVGLYPSIPFDDLDGLALVRHVFRRTLATCLQLGGRPYLYGSHELDELTLRDLYGEDYRRLQELRQEVNPNRLLNGHIL